MDNFAYHNPTRLVFGKGSIAKLRELIDPKHRILMTYGGGSIKKNGVYEQTLAAIEGNPVIEFGGIEANPLFETLMTGVEIAKAEKVDLLLAVGGGSVLDGTKFIAAAARYDGDPWEILSKGGKVNSAIPLGSVLTLPATGSEANAFAVISRKSTQEKLAFGSDHCFPTFSILDPTTTYSLPARQVRNGIVDAFVHVMEQYATFPVNAAMQDRQAEAVLQTLIEQGPLTLAKPDDYDSRANLVWAATQALNGTLAAGVPQDWATHMIGHELTAFYGLDHAETLAVVLPSLLRRQMATKQAKLAQLGRRVFGISNPDDTQAASQAVDRMETFFHSIDMPTRLAGYKIAPAEAASKVVDRFEQRGVTKLGERGIITPAVVGEILKAC